MVEPYSVVIPVYNGADTIAAAIASVTNQSIQPTEIVVVDDGSTDNTAETVSHLGGNIRLIQQDNAGPGAATSAGISVVTTPLLATLDADDLWLPGKIERQMAALAAAPDTAAVFGKLASFRGNPVDADYEGARDGWSRSTMLIRQEVALGNGPILDPPERLGEMVDWFARLREAGHRLTMMPEVLSLRRIRAGSLTNRNADLSRGYLQAAKAALLRRRQQRND